MSRAGRVVRVAGAVAAVALALASWRFGGGTGSSGFGLGVLGVGAGMYATWLGIRSLAAVVGETPRGERALWPVAVLVLKLPVLYACWLGAESLGPPAPRWFLFGLALVYCYTIAWALSRD